MENKLTFQEVKPFSPINTQPFIWMVEYFLGDGLTEFDLNTQEPNPFQFIDKSKVKRFGLIGNGAKLFFNSNGGIFRLLGNTYQFAISIDNMNYPLNPLSHFVNDIITYKKAEAIMNINGSNLDTAPKIKGYYFGYKTQLTIKDMKFFIKPIISITEGQPLQIILSISCDKDFSGTIDFIKNDSKHFSYPISLKSNITSKIHWNVI